MASGHEKTLVLGLPSSPTEGRAGAAGRLVDFLLRPTNRRRPSWSMISIFHQNCHKQAAAGNWNPRLWDWDSRALTARPSADALRLAGGQPQPQHAAEEHRQGAGGSDALKLQLGPWPRRTPSRRLPRRRCRRPRLLRGRTRWSGRASGGGDCCGGG
jgi:hypothetical protein